MLTVPIMPHVCVYTTDTISTTMDKAAKGMSTDLLQKTPANYCTYSKIQNNILYEYPYHWFADKIGYISLCQEILDQCRQTEDEIENTPTK